MDPGALKEWLSLPLLCISINTVMDGACAGVDRVSCQDSLHQASAPRTGHSAPKKYLTPVSGSSLLSLALPGSWDNANGFELTSVGKC